MSTINLPSVAHIKVYGLWLTTNRMLWSVTVWPQTKSCGLSMCDHKQTAVGCHCMTTIRMLWGVTMWPQQDCCGLSLCDDIQACINIKYSATANISRSGLYPVPSVSENSLFYSTARTYTQVNTLPETPTEQYTDLETAARKAHTTTQAARTPETLHT